MNARTLDYHQMHADAAGVTRDEAKKAQLFAAYSGPATSELDGWSVRVPGRPQVERYWTMFELFCDIGGMVGTIVEMRSPGRAVWERRLVTGRGFEPIRDVRS